MAIHIQGLLEKHEDSAGLVFSEQPERRFRSCLPPGNRRDQLWHAVGHRSLLQSERPVNQ